MKEATSRNVTNLQQALNVQQAYTTTLCAHINTILARVTKLEMDIQLLTEKVTMEESTDQDQHSTTHSNLEDTHRPHNFYPQIPNQLPQVSSTGKQQSHLIHQEILMKFPNWRKIEKRASLQMQIQT